MPSCIYKPVAAAASFAGSVVIDPIWAMNVRGRIDCPSTGFVYLVAPWVYIS